MQLDYRGTARFMARQFVRLAWTTTQQKWATSFVVAGLILATFVMPGLGVAVFSTAFAGWWLAVFIMTVFFGLVGNRVGVGREKKPHCVARRRQAPGKYEKLSCAGSYQWKIVK